MPTPRDRLIECFAAVFPHLGPEEVPLATTASVGEWGSLATLNLIAVIQDEFGVEIAPEDYENFISFELVLDLLEKAHAS
jgi:acyl carrier protein